MLTDTPVETTETSRQEAERMGAVAFFGDKYGETVRVVQAGGTSLEFCGGTHVDSLGQIGPITLLSEGTIGSNTRRIFAVTGQAALERAREREHLVRSAADLLRTEPDELLAALGRLVERQREAEKELARLRQQSSEPEASSWPAAAAGTASSWPAATSGPRCAAALAQAVLAPRRRARRRPRRLARRHQGGARRRDRRGRPTPPRWCAPWAPWWAAAAAARPRWPWPAARIPSRIDEALAEARRLLSA